MVSKPRSSVNTLDLILSRLERVHQRGENRWMARCPSHDDGGPSLSVRLADSGNILLHCFAGCTVHDICAAIGVRHRNLFADAGSPEALTRSRNVVARQLIEHSKTILTAARANIAAGMEVSDADVDLIITAINDLEKLRNAK